MLARQIHEYTPREIVVVMKDIEPNVRRAAQQAGSDELAIHELPFPRSEHRARYVDELSHLVKRMRGRGSVGLV